MEKCLYTFYIFSGLVIIVFFSLYSCYFCNRSSSNRLIPFHRETLNVQRTKTRNVRPTHTNSDRGKML